MRILVTSSLYPPVAFGGYEVECSAVVDHLRSEHEVLVLTSDRDRDHAEPDALVRRELPWLALDAGGSLQAPIAARVAAGAAERALAWEPDLIYVWNGASFPQTALRVLADSGTPVAFRVCEHWFGKLFVADRYMRELLPASRGPLRAGWSTLCKAWNRLPGLRVDPSSRFPAAISWNSQAVRRNAGIPPSVDPVLERLHHSVPRYGLDYEGVIRSPAAVPEILFLGRVTPNKGAAVAVRAIAELRDAYDIDADLVVAGPVAGDHGAELESLAKSLNIGGRIRQLGQLPPEDVADRLARAHALIVPSVWQEPFPLVTIEGAFAGVPLVASDVGGIGEGMRDEEHALLFPPGDHRAAAAALARILNEPEQTRLRVSRARARAERFRLGPYLKAQEEFVLDARWQLRRADRRGDGGHGAPGLESGSVTGSQ